LDNVTIGVAGEEIPEWKEVACFVRKIPLEMIENKPIIRIPKEVFDFNHLGEKHKVTTVNGNELLITVSTGR